MITDDRPWVGCYTCKDFLDHRGDALVVPMSDKAIRERRDPFDVVNEFMAGAHQRHLDGKSLRPGGPTRVTDPNTGSIAALFAAGLAEEAP